MFGGFAARRRPLARAGAPAGGACHLRHRGRRGAGGIGTLGGSPSAAYRKCGAAGRDPPGSEPRFEGVEIMRVYSLGPCGSAGGCGRLIHREHLGRTATRAVRVGGAGGGTGACGVGSNAPGTEHTSVVAGLRLPWRRGRGSGCLRKLGCRGELRCRGRASGRRSKELCELASSRGRGVRRGGGAGD